MSTKSIYGGIAMSEKSIWGGIAISASCVDICDRVIGIMCLKCPHYNSDCMPEDDEANHEQMLYCISSLERKGEYPNKLDVPWESEE
jgi:hypothetical protein